METEIYKKLKTLIEALTHCGSNTLNEDMFKEVKKICKSSRDNIPHVYNLVLTQLKKNNSQIRLSAFQIYRELFKRSNLFRESVLKDLHLIFELTAEINSSKKLPPPKYTAECLKTLSISTLKEWVKEFGETYKQLKVAYNYLKKCRQVDFATFQVHNSTEQVVQNERHRRLRAINDEKIKKVVEEFSSNEPDIEMTITSLSNCLSLLLPPAEEFFIPEHNFEDVKNTATNSKEEIGTNVKEEECNEDSEAYVFNNKNGLREFGIPLDYNLTIQLDVGEKFKVKKTEENSSVIENAKDCVRLINNRFLPMIKKFIKIYCKSSNRVENEFKKIVNAKEKLENVLKKYSSIVIDQSSYNPNNESSSDDDFEEVKKDGYEESVKLSEGIMLEGLKRESYTNDKPQTSKGLCKETVQTVSTSTPNFSEALTSNSQELLRKRKLLSIAPKLPYDIDLYHWEDEQLTIPTLISTKIDVDKFWGSAGSDEIHEIPNPNGLASLRTRVIEYSGTFEPVKWTCRAPLANGKLCPRKDRFKCPFHGKIVARDGMGLVQNKDDKKKLDLKLDKCHRTVTEFQDPEFLRDIQDATGVDLRMPERKGKKRKLEHINLTHKKMKTTAAALKLVESKKLPGLTDIVKKQNNAYMRLSKKVFNRSSLRKVSHVLDKLNRNKFLDKFGDQFNYI